MKSILILTFILSLTACVQQNDNISIIKHEELSASSKICIIGDAGTGESSQYDVAKMLEDENCDHIRYVGDVIYQFGITSSLDPQFKSKFYNPYKNLLEAKPVVPFYMALGNHDYYGNPNSWIDLAKKYPDSIIYPKSYYAESWGDICFITFDTNTGFEEQIKWLDSIKKLLDTSCKLSLAFGHHPYLSVGEHGDATSKVKIFLESTVVGKMDIYFAGHDHNLSDEGEVKGTTFIVSGAGAKLRPLEKKPRVFAVSELGYVTLEVTRNELNVPIADYKFVTLNQDGKAEVVYQGSVTGHGLR